MKSLMILVATSFLLSSNAKAVPDWEGVYLFDNGTKITRKRSGLTLEPRGSGKFTCGRGISIRKGTGLGTLTANDDVSLSTDMDSTQFRRELLKLGRIRQAIVNPPEEPAPAARKRAFGVNRPAAPAARKRAFGVNRPAAPAARKRALGVNRPAAPAARKRAFGVNRPAAPAARKRALGVNRPAAPAARKRALGVNRPAAPAARKRALTTKRSFSVRKKRR